MEIETFDNSLPLDDEQIVFHKEQEQDRELDPGKKRFENQLQVVLLCLQTYMTVGANQVFGSYKSVSGRAA